MHIISFNTRIGRNGPAENTINNALNSGAEIISFQEINPTFDFPPNINYHILSTPTGNNHNSNVVTLIRRQAAINLANNNPNIVQIPGLGRNGPYTIGHNIKLVYNGTPIIISNLHVPSQNWLPDGNRAAVTIETITGINRNYINIITGDLNNNPNIDIERFNNLCPCEQPTLISTYPGGSMIADHIIYSGPNCQDIRINEYGLLQLYDNQPETEESHYHFPIFSNVRFNFE